MVVSLVCLANLGPLVCTAILGLLGHQVVMAVMAVKEPKVTRAARERLDPRDLQELLVSMDKMAPKENLESKVHPARRVSVERVEQEESLGIQMWWLIETGKSARGKTWMTAKITVWLRWMSIWQMQLIYWHCGISYQHLPRKVWDTFTEKVIAFCLKIILFCFLHLFYFT